MCRVRCWKSSSRASSRKPVLTSREAIRQLAGRLIAGKTDVRWDEDGAPDATIAFSDSDVEALTEALDSFVGKDLPKLTENVSLKTARRVLRRLKKNWPERALWEEQTQAAFEARLAPPLGQRARSAQNAPHYFP
jgi:hypothetical protein